MAQFAYKALTPAGEAVEGQMEAASEAEVIARIQEAGNLPLSASPIGEGFSWQNFRLARRTITQKQVGEFTDQLATLLTSGMPLDRSLSVMIDLADDERLQAMIKAMRDKVRGGGNLSDALEEQHVFSKLYVNMVRAGEMGGTLEKTLQRLSDYQSRSQALKDSVVSAMIYPAILLVLAVGSLFILLGKVVPSFQPMFEESGMQLPVLTQIVLGAARFVTSYWWLLFLLVAGAALLLRQRLTDPAFRYRWDERKLRVPLFGDLIRRLETARFTRTLGTLLDSGVPLLSGLGISRNVMNNAVLVEAVEKAAERVKHGDPLADALADAEHFPRLAQQLIAVGEETGKLDEMLLKTATTYDEEVKTTVDRMLSVLVPASVLVLAGIIALIVFAILLAMLGMNDLMA